MRPTRRHLARLSIQSISLRAALEYPKVFGRGGLLFNALAAQSQEKYTRFHYVYAGLHGLPADLVLRATEQAVLGPRLGHAGCVVPADPNARRQLAAGATVRLRSLA